MPDYEQNPKLQSEIYGKMAAISGIGITIGPVIGGHIVDDYPNGFMVIGIAVGACFLLNAGNFLLIKYILQSTVLLFSERPSAIVAFPNPHEY